MSSFWATDDGWPYEDSADEVAEVGGEPDDDQLTLATSGHLMDGLDEAERTVLGARFGLGGAQVLSMKQLQKTTGMGRDQLKSALSSGLGKVRRNLGVPPFRSLAGPPIRKA